MFKNEGADHTDRQNRVLAGYLAGIGGYVNSAGFVLVGSLTSHVTGNVGRFANDLASAQWGAAGAAAVMITSFFAGAFVASMMIESHFFRRLPIAYGFALCTQAMLLVVFTVISNLNVDAQARFKDMESLLLCVGMGMQNSLVSRLSGAVVRTTHLTGVVTDVGIEAARWFRYWRGRVTLRLKLPYSFGAQAPRQPSVAKSALLVTIAGAFTIGAVFGGLAGVRLPRVAMLLPSAAVALAGFYAFYSGRSDSPPSMRPRHEMRR